MAWRSKPSERWRSRPFRSALLSFAIVAAPIVAAVVATTLISRTLPAPRSPLQFLLAWLVLTGVAFAVLWGVDRAVRRLVPLTVLLKLSMLFPDRAPSRFAVARDAASVRRLQTRLEDARRHGLAVEPTEAARSVLTLIASLGAHDRRTRGHSERVHVFTELLASELDLPEHDRDRLRWAALLHDIGKLLVPADVLNKPGRPDDEEWEVLRRHPQDGIAFIAPLVPWLGEWALAVAQHHERFDGTGYPQGLTGTDISRSARIVAVADAFEVMTAPRPYRRAVSPGAAREELTKCAGTQFDPAIVRAFLCISLFRLRGALGPLALVLPMPAAQRLASFGRSVGQGVAVAGMTALAIGAGLVTIPSPPDVAAADEVSAVGDDVAPGASPVHGPVAGRARDAGPASAHRAGEAAAGAPAAGGDSDPPRPAWPSDERAPLIRNGGAAPSAPGQPGDGAGPGSGPAGSPPAPAPAELAPQPAAQPAHGGAPAPSASGGGAEPEPPTSGPPPEPEPHAPGPAEPDPPDGPPASPNPPGGGAARSATNG